MTPYKLVEVYLRMGGTYCLHLQHRRLSQPDKYTMNLNMDIIGCFEIR
jgi:hypothetical protein